MFGIGLGELLVIGVVALLVIGPERLPATAAQAGRMLRSLQEAAGRARRDLDEALGPEITDLARSVQDLDPRRALLAEGTQVRRAAEEAGNQPPAGAGPAGAPVIPPVVPAPTDQGTDPVIPPRVDPDAL